MTPPRRWPVVIGYLIAAALLCTAYNVHYLASQLALGIFSDEADSFLSRVYPWFFVAAFVVPALLAIWLGYRAARGDRDAESLLRSSVAVPAPTQRGGVGKRLAYAAVALAVVGGIAWVVVANRGSSDVPDPDTVVKAPPTPLEEIELLESRISSLNPDNLNRLARLYLEEGQRDKVGPALARMKSAIEADEPQPEIPGLVTAHDFLEDMSWRSDSYDDSIKAIMLLIRARKAEQAEELARWTWTHDELTPSVVFDKSEAHWRGNPIHHLVKLGYVHDRVLELARDDPSRLAGLLREKQIELPCWEYFDGVLMPEGELEAAAVLLSDPHLDAPPPRGAWGSEWDEKRMAYLKKVAEWQVDRDADHAEALGTLRAGLPIVSRIIATLPQQLPPQAADNDDDSGRQRPVPGDPEMLRPEKSPRDIVIARGHACYNYLRYMVDLGEIESAQPLIAQLDRRWILRSDDAPYARLRRDVGLAP